MDQLHGESGRAAGVKRNAPVVDFCVGRYGRNRIAQAAGTVTVASAFTIAMLSFGTWQSWSLSGLLIIAGITVAACRDPDRTN